MNIEYINPFIEASQIVIKKTTNLQARLGKVYIRNKPYEVDTPMIEVGLCGKISGKAVLTVPLPIAYIIISNMMMGVQVSEMNDLGRSALAELANMIMGNTATILYNKGVGIDISTPQMTFGDGVTLPPQDLKTISIPLILDDLGAIELDISVDD